MPPDLQLSHLKTLIAIEENGSFHAAADVLGRSQSAITQQMQKLEEVVGKPLFVTTGRKRKLTEAGQTLVRHGHEIVSLCRHAVSSAERSHNSGVVRIGAPLEIANELLPGVMQLFEERWPATRIELHVERSRRLMELLEAGSLDLTLSTWRSGSTEGKRIKLLQVYWIASKEWGFNRNEPLPLILTDAPSMFRRIGLNALELNGWTYYEKFTTRTPAGIRFAVEAGLGLTARTTSAFRSDVQILGPESGLPDLPKVSYFLHRSMRKTSEEVQFLYDTIIDRAS